MDHERHDEAFEGDIKLTVIGKPLHPGGPAPAFSLDTLGPGDAMPHPVSLADGASRPVRSKNEGTQNTQTAR